MSKFVEFFIPGTPVPQGSKTVAKSGSKVWLRDANPAPLKAWRKKVSDTSPELLWDVPVGLQVVFFMPRPKSVTREYPSVKPDIDKLERALLDGLTGKLFTDDSRVVALSSNKAYADNREAGVEVVAWTL